MIANPDAIRDRPAAPVTRTPTRAAIRGEIRDNGMTIAAIGSSESAASSGEKPCTSWRYGSARKRKPNIARNWTVSDAEPAPNPRRRKWRGSSIGSSRLSSHRTKPTIPTTAATSAVSVTESPQPRTGPSIIANTSAPRPPTDNRVPTGSSRGGRLSRDEGTIASVPISASVARTTLSTKIDGHENHCRSRPDVSRPRMPPPAATPTQVPTALPRSAGGKTVVMTDRVTGITNAAPTPEAVTERARRQQERREDERVPVDDPLELALRCPRVARDSRQGDVQAGDPCNDHHQREAHDAEHRAPPPLFTHLSDPATHDEPPR